MLLGLVRSCLEIKTWMLAWSVNLCLLSMLILKIDFGLICFLITLNLIKSFLHRSCRWSREFHWVRSYSSPRFINSLDFSMSSRFGFKLIYILTDTFTELILRISHFNYKIRELLHLNFFTTLVSHFTPSPNLSCPKSLTILTCTTFWHLRHFWRSINHASILDTTSLHCQLPNKFNY